MSDLDIKLYEFKLKKNKTNLASQISYFVLIVVGAVSKTEDVVLEKSR